MNAFFKANVKNDKSKRRNMMFFLIIIMAILCINLFVFVSKATADSNSSNLNESEEVILNIDAGFGIFSVHGSPHTIQTPAIIGEHYPNFLFTEGPHRVGCTLDRYFYYDSQHHKITIDKNSIVKANATNLYVDWTYNDFENNRWINVEGSLQGHRLFSTISINHITGEKTIGSSTKYSDKFDKMQMLTDIVYYKLVQLPDEENISLSVYTKNNEDLMIEKIYTPISNNGESLIYWVVNNEILNADTEYSINLFQYPINLESFAVYENDIINSTVTGNEGHLSYSIKYTDSISSYVRDEKTFNIPLFRGLEFYYQWNENNTLDLWFGTNESLLKPHINITPKFDDNHSFDKWTIENMAIPKNLILYYDLNTLLSSNSTILNINSHYNLTYNPIIQPEDTLDNSNNLSESAQTYDNLPIITIISLLFMFSVSLLLFIKRALHQNLQ